MGNTWAKRLAKSIIPLYRRAIGAVVAAATGTRTQTQAASTVNFARSRIQNIVKAQTPPGAYLNAINAKIRNKSVNNNRRAFGMIISPNSKKWWSAVNLVRSQRASRLAQESGAPRYPPMGPVLGATGSGPGSAVLPARGSNNHRPANNNINKTNGLTGYKMNASTGQYYKVKRSNASSNNWMRDTSNNKTYNKVGNGFQMAV